MDKDHQVQNEKEIEKILREDELDTIEIEDNEFGNEYHLTGDEIDNGTVATA